MIYLFLIMSATVNVTLVWYIRKLLTKYWFDVEVREKFTEMLEEYVFSIESIYKLEEFYGEETLKKAIAQTKFVVQACKEFKEILEKETEESPEKESSEEQQEDQESEESVIRLKEGESISQDAASYKRIITERN